MYTISYAMVLREKERDREEREKERRHFEVHSTGWSAREYLSRVPRCTGSNDTHIPINLLAREFLRSLRDSQRERMQTPYRVASAGFSHAATLPANLSRASERKKQSPFVTMS